ncbi:MAG TPA: MFS transporter, partial [Candidatus Dormibacteraeota bacterium]|nr:MFS transporter [Candidatus Dormibacteraeota bacterium]
MPRAALESRRMLYLYVAAGATFGTIGARGLTVPLYAHQLGASRFAVGALYAAATIAAAALSLPSGILVDRFGARKLIGASILITAASLLATSATTTVAPLFLWQVLGGISLGIMQSAAFSAVAESVPRSKLGRAMGWLTLAMQAGFFLGPSLAGLALSWIDIRADIALTAAAMALAVPAALVTSNTTQRAPSGIGLKEPLLALSRQRAFIQITLGLVGVTLVWGTVTAFLPVFGKEALGLPSSQVGYLLALQAIVNGASRIPAGRIVDAARERWKIVIGGGIVWALAATLLGHTTGFLVPAVLLIIGTPFMA